MNLRVNSFKFLGYEFTHKSEIIPKKFIQYYKNSSSKFTFKQKCSDFIKLILGKIFKNYEVETQAEKTFRDWTLYDYDIIEGIKNGTIKNIFFSAKEIEKMKKMRTYDEEVAFLRKLEKEGRFKKVSCDSLKNGIYN